MGEACGFEFAVSVKGSLHNRLYYRGV
jgi:hypothetical protein